MRSKLFFAGVVFALVTARPAHGTVVVTFELIPGGFGANDMTPDGRYVVGETDLNGDFIADGTYIYDTTTQVMTMLPAEGLNAAAVSDDGSVVLGDMPDPEDPDPALGVVAGMWTTGQTEWQSLGYLPNALECPSRSDGYELSADGSVAVGLSWDGCSGRGFRWTEATGMEELQVLGFGGNRASAVSADGNLIGGFAQGTASRTPAIWNADGTGELLDPTANARGEVYGISDDGTILLGNWATTEPNTLATQWTLDETGWARATLGDGAMQFGWVGIAMDIADTGTIVGFDFNLGNRKAWLLDGGTPPYLDLRTFVESNGGNVPALINLEVCQAISTNGRFICGHGTGKAWVVTIDLLGDMNCDGLLTIDDCDPFIQSLLDPAGYAAAFPTCTIGHADMNQDEAVDGLDIQMFIEDLLTP